MKTLLEFCGLVLIGLALLHVVFPRRFRWKEELAALSQLNREIMWVHTGFIALTVFLMGLLCLTSAADLISTPLGRRMSLGLGIFWLMRLLVQFFGYSTTLWRGKRFETWIHRLFVLLWTGLTAVFFLAGFSAGP